MTKFYINKSTKEAYAVPNVTNYLHCKLIQQGYVEVTDRQFDKYVKELDGDEERE